MMCYIGKVSLDMCVVLLFLLLLTAGNYVQCVTWNASVHFFFVPSANCLL